MPVRQSSLFGRLFQSQGTMYGEMLTHGYSWVFLDAGTYIGHNAIIRVAAFRRSGVLPILPGDPPLGGHILSHDHVEAAMMRKAVEKAYPAFHAQKARDWLAARGFA